MNRRHLLAGLLVLPASSLVVPETLNRRGKRTALAPLVPSGPVISIADGQLIENLDIDAHSANAITVLHRRVTVRNCRIRHAAGHGVHATGATELVLQDLEIDHVGTPPSGAGPSEHCNNVNLEGCSGTSITRVKASRGSSNVYAEGCDGAHMSLLELHDARGPFPRGQNVQLNGSPDSILEDFSAENGPTSWTEDNISVFRSDRCAVRRGLVSYNNSPTGDGVRVLIEQNGTAEWPADPDYLTYRSIGPADHNGYTSDVDLTVSAGDILRFVVWAGATNTGDLTSWTPSIAYS